MSPYILHYFMGNSQKHLLSFRFSITPMTLQSTETGLSISPKRDSILSITPYKFSQITITPFKVLHYFKTPFIASLAFFY